MNETIKPPAPFDAVPVGGPASVLDIPRPAPPQPRPAPRQTIPLLPLSEPPKPTAPLPTGIAPEQPDVSLTPAPNPLAGSPAPKASALSGLVWDLVRPNRAKLAVVAGVASLAVGAFGLNMLFPNFGTATPAQQTKIKIPAAEEPPKALAAAPKSPAPGEWDPIRKDPPPVAPRVGEVGREPTKPGEMVVPSVPGGLPPLPGASPVKPLELPPLPIVDPNLRPAGGMADIPPAAPGAPTPLPALPGGPLPALPGDPLPAAPGGTLPVLPALPGAVTPTPPPVGGTPKPPELTPALPAMPPGGGAVRPAETPPAQPAGGLPTLPPIGGGPVVADPVTTPALPPVVLDPFGGTKPAEVKPLPLPGLPTPPPGGVTGTPPATPGAMPLPGLPTPGEVTPLPPAAPPALPPTPAPREPVIGAGGIAPAPTTPVVGVPTSTPPATPPVTEAKTEYDVDLHRPRAGDTYATVSQSYYGGAQFAGALQAFNRNQPIDRIAEVQVPPVHVIRKFASPRGGDPAPDRFTPTRPAATDEGPEWGAPGAALGGQTVYTLFKVPRTGMTLQDVAKVFFDSERSWAKLNNSRNPKFDPDEELPVGTQLYVPTGTVPFR